MKKVHRETLVETSAPSMDRADGRSPPARDADRRSVVVAGRNGGLKSAINRPLPADAAARRKAALHALRFAFEAEVTEDDRPSSTAPSDRQTSPSHDN